jgi:hypothetical protein
LLAPPERVREYYRAYRLFANILEGREDYARGTRHDDDGKVRIR